LLWKMVAMEDDYSEKRLLIEGECLEKAVAKEHSC